MDVTPTTRWGQIIEPEMNTLGKELFAKDANERNSGHTIYPPHNQIFRALNETLPYKTKVVIVGQDPYIREGQAEGLCFSVANGCEFPPSLKNIFKELHDDLGISEPSSGSLIKWAKQGVLLLNTSLTVEAGHPTSHSNWGWDKFTAAILRAAANLEQPIVFIGWGSHARKVLEPLNLPQNNKRVIYSTHPSPLSAYRGFFGSKPFSKTNVLLQSMGAMPVDWRL